MTYHDIPWHIMTWLLAERDFWQNMPISYLYVATSGDWWFTIIFMISHHYQLSMKITRLIRPWNKNYIYFRPEDGAASASGRKWQGSFRIIHLPLLFKTFTFLKMAIVSQIDRDDNISINIHMLWAGWGSQCNNSTVAFTRYPIHYFGLKKNFYCGFQHLFYHIEYFCQIWIVEEVMLGGEWFSVSERKAGVFIPSISKNYGHTWARGKRLNNRLSFLSTKPTKNVWREQEMYKKKKGDFSSGL